MFNLIVASLTVLSVAIIIYHHVGYPLILKWANKNSPNTHTHAFRRGFKKSFKDSNLPSITLVIPAYNEAQWIAEKIRNLACIDYPSQQLSVIIACDGCTDNTVSVASVTSKEPECKELNISVVNFCENRGKVAVLNDVISNVSSDLVALSDVSALISIDALLLAAERFKDPAIGVLNGNYRLLTPGSVGEETYWNYQSQLKRSEAAFGGSLGSHGAFYLFRTHLFEPLAEDTINDDFILPMKIVAAGYRADYEASINALELENAGETQDHQRRRRIAAGNLQQLFRLKALLSPRYGKTAFSFMSGKALRVFMPAFMLIALFGAMMLANDSIIFLAGAAAQILGYGMAIFQLLFKPENSPKLFKVLAYIVGGHSANFIGSVRYALKLDRGRWFKFSH